MLAVDGWPGAGAHCHSFGLDQGFQIGFHSSKGIRLHQAAQLLSELHQGICL
jgi:hypothetical protein